MVRPLPLLFDPTPNRGRGKCTGHVIVSDVTLSDVFLTHYSHQIVDNAGSAFRAPPDREPVVRIADSTTRVSAIFGNQGGPCPEQRCIHSS